MYIVLFYSKHNLATNYVTFLEILRLYFKGKLEELSNMIDVHHEEDACQFQLDNDSLRQQNHRLISVGEMDIDTHCHGCNHNKDIMVNNIGKVVRDLRSLGFTSITEDAYASSILLLLKVRICCFV